MKKNLLIIFIVIIFLSWVYISRSRFTSSSSDIYSFYEKFKNKFELINQSGAFKSVDMVYTVAMPQRKDYITKQMDTLGVEYKYFDAIKKGDLTDSEISQISKVNTSGSSVYKLPTRLFHTLSFTMCFIDAIKNEYSNIIIFEDDIVINVEIPKLNASLMEFDSSDNEFFFLGYCFLNCRQHQDKEKYDYLIELSDPSILCNHACAIKVSALPKLVEYLFPMKIATDEAMANYFRKNKTKVCIPKKPYFDQVDRDKMESLNESTNKLQHCR
jgi:hypothetical protein